MDIIIRSRIVKELCTYREILKLILTAILHVDFFSRTRIITSEVALWLWKTAS